MMFKKGSALESLLYRGIYSVARYFEDPTGLDRPLAKDYSKYQWPLNLGVAVLNGVLAAVHRAGISWGYPDPNALDWNSQVSMYPDLYNSTYHVIYCDQPVVRQADQIWYAIQPEPTNFPRAIDLEVNRGISNEQYADATWEMSELVNSRDGVRPIIYSRAGLINQWLAPYWTEDMMNLHKWWLAQYLFDTTREHPGPPDKPNKVLEENIWLHQTASKKPGFPGESGGTSYTDYDRWEIGNAQDMAFIIDEYMGNTPAPPPSDLAERVAALELGVNAINAELLVVSEDLDQANAILGDHEQRITALESQDQNTVEAVYTVTDDKAIGHVIAGTNANGKPIMVLPPVGERVRWDNGQTVWVFPEAIDADGPYDFYKVSERKGYNGEDIFLSEADGVI